MSNLSTEIRPLSTKEGIEYVKLMTNWAMTKDIKAQFDYI